LSAPGAQRVGHGAPARTAHAANEAVIFTLGHWLVTEQARGWQQPAFDPSECALNGVRHSPLLA